jgi:hypothetical protein
MKHAVSTVQSTVYAYHIELDELRAEGAVDEGPQLPGDALVLQHKVFHSLGVLGGHQLRDLALQLLQDLIDKKEVNAHQQQHDKDHTCGDDRSDDELASELLRLLTPIQ